MPDEQIPIQPVGNPILCSPYAEPDQHWLYDTRTGNPSKTPVRRPASSGESGALVTSATRTYERTLTQAAFLAGADERDAQQRDRSQDDEGDRVAVARDDLDRPMAEGQASQPLVAAMKVRNCVAASGGRAQLSMLFGYHMLLWLVIAFYVLATVLRDRESAGVLQ